MTAPVLVILACLLPPSPQADTAVYRLKTYYEQPKVEFCYKWDPSIHNRIEQHWAASLARSVKLTKPQR